MQKSILFAFVLLTLSLTSAEYIEKNFYKLPVTIANSTSFNLGYLSLQDLDSKSLSLTSSYFPNRLAKRGPWSVWYREFDPITFETIAKVDRVYVGNDTTLFYGGYAIEFNITSDKLIVDQFNLKQNTYLPNFTMIDNTYTYLQILSTDTQGETIYVTFQREETIEILTFKVGETFVRQNISIPIKLSIAVFQLQVVAARGGVLSENQIFATIQDQENLYEVLVDLEKGTYNLSKPSNYESSLMCTPYVTNKTYGSFCKTNTYDKNNVSVSRPASGKLEQLPALKGLEHLEGQFTNGDYLVTVIQDSGKEGTPMSYELWDLETMSSVKGRVEFIAGINEYLSTQFFQSQSDELYVLMNNGEKIRLGVLLSQNSMNVTASFDEDELIQNFLA